MPSPQNKVFKITSTRTFRLEDLNKQRSLGTDADWATHRKVLGKVLPGLQSRPLTGWICP